MKVEGWWLRVKSWGGGVYRGISLIRDSHPPRTTIGP